MTNNLKNKILFIGQDKNYARSVVKILNYCQEEYSINIIGDLVEVKNLVQSEPIGAVILDADLVKDDAQNSIEKVLGFTKNAPLVLMVNEDQENLGQFALEQGAFDYLVKVEGSMTSIPFTINRALEYKPEIEEVPIDFPVESDLKEQTSFFEINETGRFLTIDDNLSTLLGSQKNEFYKSYLMDFVTDEDRDLFYKWRASPKKQRKNFLIHTEIIHREQGVVPVELQLQPFGDPDSMFSGFRGYLKILYPKITEELKDKEFDIISFFHEVYQLNTFLRQGFSQLFLMKLTEIPQKYFHFSYAGLYLHKTVSNNFAKELSIGEEINKEEIDLRSDSFEVSEINQLFCNGEFLQVVHQSVLHEEEREKILGNTHSELFQEKPWETGLNWQIGDRLIINLRNSDNSSQGIIILDQPETGKIPSDTIRKYAELYAIFLSSLFEFQMRYKNLETKYKQFKQIFTILETFNIEQPLEGLLKEIVWTIKFSLGFNLSALAVFSKSTRMLHMKAIAVEGKEKIAILNRLYFNLEEVNSWIRNKYCISHSYLVTSKNSMLHVMKRIYGSPLSIDKNDSFWKNDDTLLVPIRISNQKIIGFFIVDDPANKLRPSIELVQIVEKIANLVAVTIENKITYTKLKSELKRFENNLPPQNQDANRIKKIFKRIHMDIQ